MRRLLLLAVFGSFAACASGGNAPALRPVEFDRQKLVDAGLPDSLVVEYDSGPILQNTQEIDRALRREYPEDAKRRGESGRISALLRVGIAGGVEDIRFSVVSEYESLNNAALNVFRQMQFSPALNQGRPVAAWIPMWVVFEVIF